MRLFSLPLSVAFGVLLATAAIPGMGATPSAPATTQADPAADRLTFLTLQLSSIEASLNAVNLALRGAGYKVVLASEKANQYAKGNELMDRKGGAPIAWDKFYGATARQFEPRDIYGVPHPYERPSQFDYLYKANNEQINKANQDIAAVEKKVDTLLARRRSLEAEQSSLWATISWESLENHDIPLNPLYRFQLKAKSATPAADARRDVLRPAILFLRTIDQAVADDLDSLHTNQEQTLNDLSDRTHAAYSSAKEPFANAMLSADLSTEDLKTAKDLLTAIKHLAELAKNVTEAYHLALDGDAANDDGRKLTFRAQLQFALLDYSNAAADLDYQLAKLANTWGLEGERGIASPDHVAPGTTKITPVKQDNPEASVPRTLVPSAQPQLIAPLEPSPSPSDGIDLLPLISLEHDAMRGRWSKESDGLMCNGGLGSGSSILRLPYYLPTEYDFVIEFTILSVPEGNDPNCFCIMPVCAVGAISFPLAMGSQNNTADFLGDYLKASAKHVVGNGEKIFQLNKKYSVSIRVRERSVAVAIDGKLVINHPTNYSDLGNFNGAFAVGLNVLGLISSPKTVFHKLEVIEIRGNGHIIKRWRPNLIDPAPTFGGSANQALMMEPIASQGRFRVNTLRDGVTNHVAVGGTDCKDFISTFTPFSAIYRIPNGAIGFHVIAARPGPENRRQWGLFVYLDGDEAFVGRSQPDQEIEINIPISPGAKTLELRCDPLGGNAGKECIWAYPRFAFK